MDLKKQQEALDEVKWFDSIVAGEDTCGTYDFCSFCDKSLENPCACAMRKYKRKNGCLATIRLKIGQ